MIVDIYRRKMVGKCPRSRKRRAYFTELDGVPPDQGFKRVGEIFHVD
jgi:hypothetical protein